MDLIDCIDHASRATTWLHPPGSLVELRPVIDGRRHSGYFPAGPVLAERAADLAAEKVQWTLHRIGPTRQPTNQILPAERGACTADADVIAYNCLFVDCDPRRPTGQPSTDAELDAAMATAQRIVTDMTAAGFPAPMLVISGNGVHIYWATDLLAELYPLVKAFIEYLSARYSDEHVHVDDSVYTAARLATVPGTMNVKGANTPERPHRFARILQMPERRVLVTSGVLAQLVASVAQASPTAADGPRIDHDAALAEQRAWLDKHGLAYDVEIHPGYTILRLAQCPWRPDQDDGNAWLRVHPSYGVHAGCFHAKCKGKNLASLRKLFGESDPDKAKLTDPYYLAERHAERFAVNGQPTSVWMGEELTIWGGSMWIPASDKMMGPHISATIKATMDKAGKSLPISRRLVGDTLAALHSLSMMPDRLPPFWIGEGPTNWDANDVIPFANGVLHLPSWLAGSPHHFIRPTPLFYNRHKLAFGYDPAAPAPARWLQFLRELWDDPACHDLLHEWGGYCMSRDTSRQKLMMLIGEPRGGKGTVCRVMGEMVGGNFASPSLKSLIGDFGLAPLYGRQLAICPDAKNLPAKIVGEVCAQLKAITGEDAVLINPKGKQQFTDRLRIKLIIQSNDELAIPDHSAALQARQLFLRFDKSFLGREDTQLDAKLAAELPGIANFFLAGLRRLSERGQFSEPEASRALAAKIKKAANPIVAYVTDRCAFDPSRSIPIPDLYADHIAWAADTDTDALSPSRFARDLLATFRHLERARPRAMTKGKRPYHYVGIGLREAT